MPRSVVDEVFLRARPYPTVATRAQPEVGAEPRPAPPRDDFGLLTVDELAEVMRRALDLATEPPETPQPMSDRARIRFMQEVCNSLRTLRLVNATLNSPALLQETFGQIAEKMKIDPIEVAHRPGELNGAFLVRIRALLQERCRFLSKLTLTPDMGRNKESVRDAASNTLLTSVELGGNRDLHATNAERLARCLWYSAWTRDAMSLLYALQRLITHGWATEILTLASFRPTTLPENGRLNSGEDVLAVIGDAYEVAAVVKRAEEGADTITVAYTAASGQKEERVVPRAAVRYPPTVTCTALEHLLTRYLRPYAQLLTGLEYSQLIKIAGWKNNARAVRILIENRGHVLSKSMLETALSNAVKKANPALFVAVAQRDALEGDTWTRSPTYVTEPNMTSAHAVVERPEQTALLYLPGLPETPNYFYRARATAEQLAQWKRSWNEQTTMSRVSHLRNHVITAEQIHNGTVDPALVEAWANVPGHPLRAVDAVVLIEKLGACHQTDPRGGAWIALARRLYEQVADDDSKRLAQDGFPAARLGQRVE
jgi:hypothetical protein